MPSTCFKQWWHWNTSLSAFIIQIKAAEITASGLSYSLRFSNASLTYTLQINITWDSQCDFLALWQYGKIFRRPTVSLPQVLSSDILRHTSYSPTSSNPRDCPFGKEKKDRERHRVCPLRTRKVFSWSFFTAPGRVLRSAKPKRKYVN